MGIQSGIGQRFYVNQFDLSGDVGAIGSFVDSRNQQDITTVLDTAMRRLPLLKDGALTYTAFFDTAVGAEHLTLRGLPQSANVTWCIQGTAVGNATGSLVANHTDYPATRAQDGSLVLTPTAAANGFGIQWGNLLTTATQTFASAASGTYIDDYVPSFPTGDLPSVHGLAAYVHAISIGSGSATVHIQDSTDHISFSDVTGAVSTAISSAGTQRLVTSSTQAVNRYLRVNVTGTFTNLVCVVAVCRYIAEFVA